MTLSFGTSDFELVALYFILLIYISTAVNGSNLMTYIKRPNTESIHSRKIYYNLKENSKKNTGMCIIMPELSLFPPLFEKINRCMQMYFLTRSLKFIFDVGGSGFKTCS